MDRHDFVKNRIKERDELLEEIKFLEGKKNYYRCRTLEYLNKQFSKPDPQNKIIFNNYNLCTPGLSESENESISENNKVSDIDIVNICNSIGKLHEQKITLNREIEELQKQDVITYIKAAILSHD